MKISLLAAGFVLASVGVGHASPININLGLDDEPGSFVQDGASDTTYLGVSGGINSSFVTYYDFLGDAGSLQYDGSSWAPRESVPTTNISNLTGSYELENGVKTVQTFSGGIEFERVVYEDVGRFQVQLEILGEMLIIDALFRASLTTFTVGGVIQDSGLSFAADLSGSGLSVSVPTVERKVTSRYWSSTGVDLPSVFEIISTEDHVFELGSVGLSFNFGTSGVTTTDINKISLDQLASAPILNVGFTNTAPRLGSGPGRGAMYSSFNIDLPATQQQIPEVPLPSAAWLLLAGIGCLMPISLGQKRS